MNAPHQSQSAEVLSTISAEFHRRRALGEDVAPAELADHAVEVYDPEHASPTMIRFAAVLQFRQFARQFARTLAEETAPQQVTQLDLFKVQTHYDVPRGAGGEPIIVERMKLTRAERREISRRLRAEGAAKIKHADALDAETDALEAEGFFADEA